VDRHGWRDARQAVEHLLECVQIARTVGSDIISLWLADGTNYPGQGSFEDKVLDRSIRAG